MMKSFAGLLVAVVTTTKAVKIEADSQAESWGGWGYDDFAALPDWEEEVVEEDKSYDWGAKTEEEDEQFDWGKATDPWSAYGDDWDNLPTEEYGEDIFSASAIDESIKGYNEKLAEADDPHADLTDIIDAATESGDVQEVDIHDLDELDLGLELNAIIAAVDATCSKDESKCEKSCECGDDRCKIGGDCGCDEEADDVCGCDEEADDVCDGEEADDESEDCPIEMADKASDCADDACACAEEAILCADEACECADKACAAVTEAATEYAESDEEESSEDDDAEDADDDADAEDADDEEDKEDEIFDEYEGEEEEGEEPWWMQFYGGW